MKKQSICLLLAASLAAAVCADLEEGFKAPPRTAKPHTCGFLHHCRNVSLFTFFISCRSV